jgi:hypothetical protein
MVRGSCHPHNPIRLGGHSENVKLPVFQGLPSVGAGVPRCRNGILPPQTATEQQRRIGLLIQRTGSGFAYFTSSAWNRGSLRIRSHDGSNRSTCTLRSEGPASNRSISSSAASTSPIPASIRATHSMPVRSTARRTRAAHLHQLRDLLNIWLGPTPNHDDPNGDREAREFHRAFLCRALKSKGTRDHSVQ